MPLRVLLVDLNNFARYPTLSIGYLAALFRAAGHDVRVLSPLSVGVQGYARLMRPGPLGVFEHALRHWSGTSRSATVRRLRNRLAREIQPTSTQNRRKILAEFALALAERPDIVLVSAYTMYAEVCREMGALTAARGVPVLVGGPFFNFPEIADPWLAMPGITAVFGGEPERRVVAIAEALAGGTLAPRFEGLSTRGLKVAPAAPLEALDEVPFPDYGDFPWDRYPLRIVPMMTGRGCGWGVCTFCSDVVTGAGRGFRSRSPGNVLEEMKVQAGRHAARVFTFLDLKLNSDLSVWHGLADGAQDAVAGCQWSASLHVGIKGNDGLGLAELKAARAGGLVRLTTGLESGSDRVLKAMAKGTSAEMLSRFVRHAHEAGISVRLTAITGYPGETPDDVLATERFLRAHLAYVDRIVLNRFSIQLGTPFQRQLAGTPSRFPEITDLVFDPLTACFEHVNQTFLTPAHRRAMLGLLAAVHAINRKPLNNASATFEGVM